ncbi:MAG: TRAP transporter small permease [Halomonas sp.]|jgi:TRAP-type C4-dicarboxylate transport system permease small subunit|uniref:TRAP transporter small permease protein n=1 Tax=Billgrantia tianxiuensis TaxID=2497861 RepID=A0A6I6SRH6_9GAMM|nr:MULTISPECIES: TRAP transporter small permease [Halomonas]MCE8033611.1 TRAP transporter small permease [Halomonas sp. MCCC 1A11057]MDX5432776.1 TRAP transporter small permease [Halomonas sp.]QHC51204.1 TRAP transporter small permease [Halomonas tianxiuensis]
MVDLFLRFERQLTRLAMAVAVVMLVVSVSFSFYQVLTRFVFNAPSTWSEVAARTAMIWCVFMAAAATFRGGYMMAVEAIYKVVPGRLVPVLEVAIVLCCLLVLAVLIHFGILMTQRVSNQTMSGMNVSMAYAYAAIPVGAGFAMVAVLARLLAQLSGREALGPDLGDASPEVEMHDPRQTMPESTDAPRRGGTRP